MVVAGVGLAGVNVELVVTGVEVVVGAISSSVGDVASVTTVDVLVPSGVVVDVLSNAVDAVVLGFSTVVESALTVDVVVLSGVVVDVLFNAVEAVVLGFSTVGESVSVTTLGVVVPSGVVVVSIFVLFCVVDSGSEFVLLSCGLLTAVVVLLLSKILCGVSGTTTCVPYKNQLV